METGATAKAKLSEIWPLFGLRIIGDAVELRYPSDADLVELAKVAMGGVHSPERMPFTVPWTDGDPLQVGRRVLSWHWASRANLTPEKWNLEFAVVVEDRIVGVQALTARDFAVTRIAESGSWLGQSFQGHGIGSRMRAAICDFGFRFLGAQALTSAYAEDNPASRAVSRGLGYEPSGVEVIAVRGQRSVHHQMILCRDVWRAKGRPPVRVEGFSDEVRAMLGLSTGHDSPAW